nr:hypothetical protein [Tanacetum cinerariifolium]
MPPCSDISTPFIGLCMSVWDTEFKFVRHNYGPIPFKFYHYWMELEGFRNVVEVAWKDSPCDNSNAISCFMDKYLADLEEVEGIIDSGGGNDEIAMKRAMIVQELRDIDKRCSLELAQKATPGPDGFTFGFYRQFWYLIDEDVYKAVNLIGSLYKIISKILANRLVGVLDNIVNEVQSAFIANRQNGPFILDELIRWCKRKKRQLLVFKVDFEKAYDSVRWDFLDDILRKFGFGEKWCKWILSCLRSSRGSTLVNGSLMEEFLFCKGLKQGDPLSPFLFILIMESLHLSFQRVEDAGLFTGISRLQAWNDVVERVNMRLSRWKMKSLSIGGRFTLLKSVLRLIPIFHMSIFKAPVGVLRKLESIRSHFFNGHDLNCNKASWVDWKAVLSLKGKGGLGVSSLFALNRGLMFKWIWRFYSQDRSLWVRVIKAIYGNEGNMGGRDISGYSSTWMNIVNEAYSMISKDGTVATKLAYASLDCSFHRCPRGGAEHMQFEELLADIQKVRLTPMVDRWSWTLTSSGEYSVESVRKEIDDKLVLEGTHKTRWCKFVPIKINVFAWKVMTDSLPSRFNYADIFTKGLPSALFDEFRDSLSVRCTPAPTAGEY